MVFHAFGCHAERFCDLFVRFVFVATHDEDTAGLFREGGQCLFTISCASAVNSSSGLQASRVEMRVSVPIRHDSSGVRWHLP